MNVYSVYRYNILFLCVTYIIPLAVMAVCYTIMGKELWGSKTIGQMTQRHMESIKSKRKVSNTRRSSIICIKDKACNMTNFDIVIEIDLRV